MQDVIFEYKRIATCGFFGEDAGESVTVYQDGSVYYRIFVFGSEKPQTEVKVTTNPKLAARMEERIRKRQRDLEKIPSKLDNDSDDGDFVDFIFGGKVITTLNIERTDIEKLRIEYPEYYQKFKENAIYENVVLDIYNEMVSLLRKFRVRVFLLKM